MHRHLHPMNVLSGKTLRWICTSLVIFFGALWPCGAQARWEKEMEAFAFRDQQSPFAPGGILFVGSSSIRLWQVEKAFPEHRVLNRGFGGSQIRDSIEWFDRVIAPHRPRLMVFYAGGNDIHAGKDARTVIADARELFEKVRAVLPETKILYLSIAPNPARWKEIETVRKVNKAILAMTEEFTFVRFVDVGASMLGEDGLPLPQIYRADQLHMNEEGYAIWNRIVKPLLGPPAG
jgi:lysophospholipase L1-like esterase